MLRAPPRARSFVVTACPPFYLAELLETATRVRQQPVTKGLTDCTGGVSLGMPINGTLVRPLLNRVILLSITAVSQSVYRSLPDHHDVINPWSPSLCGDGMLVAPAL